AGRMGEWGEGEAGGEPQADAGAGAGHRREAARLERPFARVSRLAGEQAADLRPPARPRGRKALTLLPGKGASRLGRSSTAGPATAQGNLPLPPAVPRGRRVRGRIHAARRLRPGPSPAGGRRPDYRRVPLPPEGAPRPPVPP